MIIMPPPHFLGVWTGSTYSCPRTISKSVFLSNNTEAPAKVQLALTQFKHDHPATVGTLPYICICANSFPFLVYASFYVVFYFLFSLSITILWLFIPLVHFLLSAVFFCSLPSNHSVALRRNVWQNDIYAV